MTLDQTAFIDAVTNDHDFGDCSQRDTPINTTFPETDTRDPLIPDLNTIFRSKLGSLQFLADLPHPDILFSTNYFSRRALHPTLSDLNICLESMIS